MLNVVVKYTYDSWGWLAKTTGSMAATLGKDNPFRYRGYYYDEESGLYYLNSRYYDPRTGRFVNADGYVSTGQGILSSNMYAYCENNPVNRTDKSGAFWSELFSAIGKAFVGLAPAYAGLGGVAVADGPLPFGDAIAIGGAIILSIGAIGYGAYQAAKSSSISSPKSEEKEKEKDIVIPSPPKRQAYFTANPYNFTPNGLVMKEYPGTKNGRIIEWRDPISQAKIFEWDEDLKNGSHYHAMMIEWDGNHHGTHYLPGTPVPEPWNSIYFGG